MKKGIRLYLNLTNKCTKECYFCCMFSNPRKHTFLSFDKFKEIIDSHSEEFELQLEGGEPLLHKDLMLFLEYARSTERCKKIIICTNTDLLRDYLPRLVEFHRYNSNIDIQIKCSVNDYLLKRNPMLLDNIQDMYLAIKYIPGFDININARFDKDDLNLKTLLTKYDLMGISVLYPLQKYGKKKDDDSLKEPFIVQNIEDWFIYACDGTPFNQDLIARSEYEGSLDNEYN